MEHYMTDSFKTRTTLNVANKKFEIYSLPELGKKHDISRLPYSLKILLENLLRCEDGVNVSKEDIIALAHWDPKAEPDQEIAFTPARVLMQDFTGVPAVVDLAAMRDAMQQLGGDPKKMPRSNLNATVNVTCSCAGANRLFPISRWCRLIPASATR